MSGYVFTVNSHGEIELRQNGHLIIATGVEIHGKLIAKMKQTDFLERVGKLKYQKEMSEWAKSEEGSSEISKILRDWISSQS